MLTAGCTDGISLTLTAGCTDCISLMLTADPGQSTKYSAAVFSVVSV